MTLKEKQIEEAVALLKEALPGLLAVYLYGSRATGHERKGSDVDFAILTSPPIEKELLSKARLKLTDKLFDKVDLIDMRSAPLTLTSQVLETGKTLFNSNPTEVATFEMILMARYADLNEERKEILEDIRRRGSVYPRY